MDGNSDELHYKLSKLEKLVVEQLTFTDVKIAASENQTKVEIGLVEIFMRYANKTCGDG